MLEASSFGPSAPQAGPPLYTDPQIGQYTAGGKAQALISAAIPQSEDCLVLNVLTPRSAMRFDLQSRGVDDHRVGQLAAVTALIDAPPAR